MKSALFRTLAVGAEVLASLLAIVGCSAKPSPEPDKPRELHWRGQDTGYKGTTIVPLETRDDTAAKQ